MPTLTLTFRGQTLAFELAKIDRDRQYGSAATETTDAASRPCSRAWLAADGRTLAFARLPSQSTFARPQAILGPRPGAWLSVLRGSRTAEKRSRHRTPGRSPQ